MKSRISDINNLRSEITNNFKPLHKTKNIKKSEAKIKTIPLSQCKNWKFTKQGKFIHNSGSFYKIEGVRVLKSYNREIDKGWDQPMFTEPVFHRGILGLLKKKINNNPHYLINAKFEPGN